LNQPRHEAERWLAQAVDDLDFTRWVLAEGRFFDKGCFIAQQAAEKALKAVHYLKGERLVFGHSVLELLNRLLPEHQELDVLHEPARLLDRYYIPTRYPNGLPGGSPFESFQRSDLESALDMAERVVAEAVRIVRTEI
jgi:HEPN domain-containing protein